VDASWTISELSERVADALATSDEPPGGKARAIPDERAIRYYTTLGLIDRATLRGRTAYYGARHLAQLVAIKKLQADGATLAEIQQLLPAIEDARLAELTGIAIGERARPAARRDFWRTPAQDAAPDPATAPEPPPPVLASASVSFTVSHQLELAPGVHLSIDAARVPTDADADALRAAAAAVLAELVRRRLVTPSQP
jgi:DNA-binding transcriptional MerR regulator